MAPRHAMRVFAAMRCRDSRRVDELDAWDDRESVAVMVHAMVPVRASGTRAGRADDGLPVPGAHVISVAVGGALLGLVILMVDLPAWDDAQRELAQTGPFTLWAAAIAFQTMAWVLAVPVIRRIARRWRTDAAVRSREVKIGTAAFLFVGAAIALVPPLLGELPETIPRRALKTTILNALAFVLATYAARAMWYVVAQLRTVAATDVVDVRVLERHQRLHRDLEALLAILGTRVSLAVIASAALRAVTVEADPETALPPQAVITYGVTLSVTLALLYVPAFLTMLSAGHARAGGAPARARRRGLCGTARASRPADDAVGSRRIGHGQLPRRGHDPRAAPCQAAEPTPRVRVTLRTTGP
jgi:hypothetical protein